MTKRKTPTDFQDTPPETTEQTEEHDPNADPNQAHTGDPKAPAESDAPQPAASDNDEPKEAPPNRKPRDPVAEAIDSITQNGLSDRRFAVRVRQVGALIADNPKFANAVDRELRMRLLARLEQFAGR